MARVRGVRSSGDLRGSTVGRPAPSAPGTCRRQAEKSSRLDSFTSPASRSYFSRYAWRPSKSMASGKGRPRKVKVAAGSGSAEPGDGTAC